MPVKDDWPIRIQMLVANYHWRTFLFATIEEALNFLHGVEDGTINTQEYSHGGNVIDR